MNYVCIAFTYISKKNRLCTSKNSFKCHSDAPPLLLRLFDVIFLVSTEKEAVY